MKRVYFYGIVFVLIVVILFLSFNLTGFLTLNQKDKDYYKIGAILPLSGDLSYLGISEMRGIVMAVDEINSQGGVNDKKLKVYFQDHHSDSTQAIFSVNNLINVNSVDIFITSISSSINSITPIILENRKLLVYYSPNPKVAEENEYIFKDYLDNYVIVKNMVKLINDLGILKIGVLSLKRESGDVLIENFISEFKKTNPDVEIYVEYYDKSVIDLSTHITKLKNRGVDGVFINDYSSAAPHIVTKMSKIFIPEYLFTLFGADPAANTKDAKEIYALSNTYSHFPLIISKDSEKNKLFNENYFLRYGEVANYDVAYAYDTVYYLKYALENCDLDRMCISNFLKENVIEGVLGKINFNEKGVNIRTSDIIKFENGEWVKIND